MNNPIIIDSTKKLYKHFGQPVIGASAVTEEFYDIYYENNPVVRMRTSVKKKDVRAIDEPFQPSILQNERIVVE